MVPRLAFGKVQNPLEESVYSKQTNSNLEEVNPFIKPQENRQSFKRWNLTLVGLFYAKIQLMA